MVELLIVLALTAGIVGLAGRLPEARRVKRELAMASRRGLAAVSTLQENTTALVRGSVAVVEPGAVIGAPATGRECVYVLITFDEVGAGGDYVELGRIERGRPFLLVTADGTARVVPERPRIALPGEVVTLTRMTALGSPHQDEPTGVKLARQVCRRPNYPASSMLRVTEYALVPGSDVTVRGYCTREPDPTAPADVTGYRSELPTRPVLSGTRKVRLVIG